MREEIIIISLQSKAPNNKNNNNDDKFYFYIQKTIINNTKIIDSKFDKKHTSPFTTIKKRVVGMLDSQVLKRLDFPAYCIKLLENGLVAIAGGGGTAKTGVTNWIEIGHVSYTTTSSPSVDPQNSFNTEFRLIAKLETVDAIMKFVCFSSPPSLTPLSTQSDLFLAAAVNDHIEIYRIQPKVSTLPPSNINNEADTNVRQRKTSTTSKQNGSAHKEKVAASQLEASAELKLVSRMSLESAMAMEKREDMKPDESIVSLQVFKSDETVMLCAGTSAGSIVVWNLEFEANNNLTNNKLNVVPVKVFTKAHGTAEIDDLQVNIDLYRLV